jgi:hypothetical protein
MSQAASLFIRGLGNQSGVAEIQKHLYIRQSWKIMEGKKKSDWIQGLNYFLYTRFIFIFFLKPSFFKFSITNVFSRL